METSSTALALLQWGIIATVLQSTPVSILPAISPSDQCMECNPQETAREQEPEPGHSTRGHTEIKSQHQD